MTGHVVITGASAGVGRATATAYGAAGWRVTLLAREPLRLEKAAAEIEEEGGTALAIPTDVAQPDAVEAAAARAEEFHGEIDVWINSAMVTVYAPIADITPEEYRRVTEVTYLGQVYGAMSALKRMRQRNRGTIVNVSSALAYHGLPLQAAYCGAKFAARGFTESLRSELLHANSDVRVSLVVLPAVNTPQFDWARNKMPHRPRPVAPVFQPEPVAAAIMEAARTAPRELVLGGSSLKLMAGAMTVPGIVDRVLAEQGPPGQQDEEPAQDRPDNLFEPVPGDFAAHGRFDDEARATLEPVRMGNVRVTAAGIGTVILAGMAAAAYASGRRNQHPHQDVSP